MNQSVPLQFVRDGLSHILSDVLQYASQTTVAGTLNGAYLGLFTSWPGFNLNLKLSDLTEATFGGYARKLISWGDQGFDKTNRPQVMGNQAQWQPADASVSQTVIGVFCASALTAGNLFAVGLLKTTQVMATTLDVLGITPRFAVPGALNPDWGEIVALS